MYFAKSMIEYFKPDQEKHYCNEENRNKVQKSLLKFHFFVALVNIAYAILHVLSKKYFSVIFDLTSLSLIVMNLFYYKKSGNSYRCAVYFVLIAMTNVSGQNIFKPTTFTSDVIWIPIAAAYCRVMLKKNHAYFMVAYFISLFCLGAINRYYYQVYLYQGGSGAGFSSVTITLIFASVLGMIFSGSLFEEQQETASLLASKNQESIELAKSKSALLAVVTHDLASPLSSLSGYIQMLSNKDEFPIEKTKKRLFKLQKACQQMNAIIKMVRKMESVESGKLEIKLSKTSIKESIEGALEILESKLHLKEIDVDVKTEGKELDKFYVLSDLNSLTINVIHNILSNAIKFSPEKSTIFIRVYFSKDFVVIEIKDEGIGMPPELVRNVFSPTTPTTRLGTNGERGTGFGLSLVKVFVDMFNGEIEVESSEKKEYSGTQFTIKIPTFDKSKDHEHANSELFLAS